jgi:catechol 2,3-dioxygenase-like lactoylglutathione lyase family enzyme
VKGRGWVASLRIALVACLAASAERAVAEPSITAIGLTVSDLDRAVAFFTGTLDFERVSDHEDVGEAVERLSGVFGAHTRTARLRLGAEEIELTEFLTPRGRAIPADSRSNDRWFQHIAIVVRDMDAAYARLRERHVRFVSSAPQRLPDWNPNAGGIRAFYFQDEDEHNLELIWFPAGKGDPRWQKPTGDRLFLGIDHTAIVVRSTEASLAFYRDVLGLHVAGASENWGTEQEHLNMVFGAHLRITGLRGTAGPGVEFLEYLTPGGGRPAPIDAASNDLAHWQTVLRVDDLKSLVSRLGSARGARLASHGVIEHAAADGTSSAAQVLDPDGHALEWIER